jgi:hypothetical protein
MHKPFILFITLVTIVAASAQDSIVVKKDPRLDVLTNKQAAANKRNGMMTSDGKYKGFRVQVMSTRDRSKAMNTKAELLTRFPEEKTYALYQAPNFKVRIGNFIKKEDADAFRKMISRLYPEGVFVVPDVIEYTPPEEEELIID